MSGRVQPKKHDSGSQANETVDGLDAYAESTRKRAEGIPPEDQDVPIFERGDLPPRE